MREALGIDWQVKKMETGLAEVLREQWDATGVKAWLVNRIFPVQIRYGVVISVLWSSSTSRLYIVKCMLSVLVSESCPILCDPHRL